MNNQIFYGNLLKLTAQKPNDADADVMEKWYEDAEFLRNVDTDIAIPKSANELNSEEVNTSSSNTEFRVRTLGNNNLVGFVAIHSIEWNNRSALLSIGIGEAENRNKGYGKDALRIILQYAFNELNLN
ncbi:GNAT family N-acetyltransferase [Heyndrickxia acidiproducens]|uniref:GNAT family N-acetyltransferase n=1 Tax=Heyndrickxia acidiproducens TaxID=1121084 RepID=UPI0003665105|nr:GNAT family N-acetyltransferase [Heyndrickxia acidiproducens]